MGCMKFRNLDQQMTCLTAVCFLVRVQETEIAPHMYAAHINTPLFVSYQVMHFHSCLCVSVSVRTFLVWVFGPCGAAAWLGFNEPWTLPAHACVFVYFSFSQLLGEAAKIFTRDQTGSSILQCVCLIFFCCFVYPQLWSIFTTVSSTWQLTVDQTNVGANKLNFDWQSLCNTVWQHKQA